MVLIANVLSFRKDCRHDQGGVLDPVSDKPRELA